MATKYEELVAAETEPDDLEAGDEPTDEPAPTEDGGEPGDPDEPADEPLAFDPKAFERENTRHEKALEKVFGASFEGMGPCGLCGGVGFTPEDVVPAPEVVADPTLVVCAECNGHGQRSTPSLDERYQLTPCTACSGTGYRDRDALEAMERAAAYAAPPAYEAPPPPPRWNPTLNRWETDAGEPVYVAPAAPAYSAPVA